HGFLREPLIEVFAVGPVSQFRVVVWAEITCRRAGARAANVHIESLRLWQILSCAEVPLAEKACGVTGFFQRFRRCYLFQRQMIEIFGRPPLDYKLTEAKRSRWPRGPILSIAARISFGTFRC